MKDIIKQETVHFIETFYAYNPDIGYSCDSDIWPIIERDPLLFIDDKNKGFGFRFFDRTKYTLSNGKSYFGENNNYSGMYYYGKRLTEEELGQVYKIMPHLKNIKSMISCERGGLITEVNEQDITIEEYISDVVKVRQQFTKSIKG